MIIGIIGTMPATPDDRGRFAQQIATTIPGVRDGADHDVRAGPHRRPARLRDADRRHQRQGQYRRSPSCNGCGSAAQSSMRIIGSFAARSTGPRRFRASAPCATEFSRAADRVTTLRRTSAETSALSFVHQCRTSFSLVGFMTGRRTMLYSQADSGRSRRDVAAPLRFQSALWAAAPIKPDDASALLVIDVQNCFLPGGTLAVKGGEQVVPVINKLAAAFENIVVTQDWHMPAHTSFAPPMRARSRSKTQARLWQPGAVARPVRPGHRRRGVHKDLALPKAQPSSARASARTRQLFGLHGGRPQDQHRPRGLPEGARHRHGVRRRPRHRFLRRWTALDARKLGFKAAVIEDASRGIDLNGSLAAAWARWPRPVSPASSRATSRFS